MIPAATATSTLSSCWGVKVECLKDEKEVVAVVVLLEAHWAPQKKKKKKKKKKITAMMQRRGIGALVQSWRGKINLHYMHFT